MLDSLHIYIMKYENPFSIEKEGYNVKDLEKATVTEHSPRINRWQYHIKKTRLYNFDPLKLHCYIVNLGFTGVYIIFLILLKT